MRIGGFFGLKRNSFFVGKSWFVWVVVEDDSEDFLVSDMFEGSVSVGLWRLGFKSGKFEFLKYELEYLGGSFADAVL